jgi:hypothetical protein
MEAFEACGGDSAAAIWRLMRPGYAWLHLLSLPQTVCNFMSPWMMGRLLTFLQDPAEPVRVGLGLAVLSALQRIVFDTVSAMDWPVGFAYWQPISRGISAALLAKSQKTDPRGRILTSSAELQTIQGKVGGMLFLFKILEMSGVYRP